MASSQPTQKSLPLILARELAANTATPFMVVDPVGTMIYYNEAAERILGQSFATSGELQADKWRGAISPKNPDGSAIEYEKLPLVIALTDRQPRHGSLLITGFDGVQRQIEVTCFPLMASGEKLVGGVALFWEENGAAQTEPKTEGGRAE
jgi:PAS domain-containing protein